MNQLTRKRFESWDDIQKKEWINDKMTGKKEIEGEPTVMLFPDWAIVFQKNESGEWIRLEAMNFIDGERIAAEVADRYLTKKAASMGIPTMAAFNELDLLGKTLIIIQHEKPAPKGMRVTTGSPSLIMFEALGYSIVYYKDRDGNVLSAEGKTLSDAARIYNRYKLAHDAAKKFVN